MASMDEVLDFARKDPVATFVAIPIAGGRPPRTRVIVQLKGRSIALPDWSGAEWAWFGKLAFRYADSVDKARSGIKLVERANQSLTAMDEPMRDLGDKHPSPAFAATYYDAAVKLVIAAHVASDREASGIMFVDAFKQSFKEVPRTIGEALAALLSAGGDVVKPVIAEAIKITAEVFEQSIGIGIGVIALIAIGVWWWSNKSKHSEG